MSLASVRAFFAERAPDIEILEATTSTATVALAAAAHGVEPARIAKTLSLRLDGAVILIVMGGEARLDNRKYKDRFAAMPMSRCASSTSSCRRQATRTMRFASRPTASWSSPARNGSTSRRRPPGRRDPGGDLPSALQPFGEQGVRFLARVPIGVELEPRLAIDHRHLAALAHVL